jgi:hypothetical protein
MTEMTRIPLNQLTLSEHNVRVVSAERTGHKQLVASIESQRILRSLGVVAAEDGYSVICGGRRLAAAQALAAEGKLEADHAVPCTVKNAESAVAASLARNGLGPIATPSGSADLAHTPRLSPLAPLCMPKMKKAPGVSDPRGWSVRQGSHSGVKKGPYTDRDQCIPCCPVR